MNSIVMLHSHPTDPVDSLFHLRRVASLSRSAQSYWDDRLVCRFANRACEEWFGIDPELIVGTTLKDFFETLGMVPYLVCAERARRGDCSAILQPFGRGRARREGWAHYVPDFRADDFAGLLIEVSPLPGSDRPTGKLTSLLGW